MKPHGTASVRSFSRRYLRKRTLPLATAERRSSTEPLAEWAVNRIRLEGRSFSFEGHEYLRAIYDDTAAHIAVCKAAQVGGTTWAILRAIHSCLRGLNCIYYFPTRTDVLDFSKSRVGPLLASNTFLRRVLNDTDTAGLKRIGEAYLYLRGMQSTVGLKSVPADLIVFDELDETTPEMKSLARERLAHSDYKWMVELSNPSLPDYGIDEAYQASDQRHWTLKCPGCGEWTALDKAFPAKLGEEVRIILPRPDGSYYRACPRCGAELDLAAGEWVADFPGRPTHGYRISQLFSSKVAPGEILQEYRLTRYPERFYNLKIGIAWANLERRLDAASVLALCDERPLLEQAEDQEAWLSMGVDTGRALHVVILQSNHEDGPARLVHLGAYRDFSDLDQLMKRFCVGSCVIDGLPETHATREFAARYAGKVFLCFFSEGQRGEPLNWDSDGRRVVVNRTEVLDTSRAAIREKRVLLPRRGPIVEEFAQHLTCDAKVLDEDEETGAKRYRYIRTGENHFSMAFTYACLASQSNSEWRAWMAYMQWLRARGSPWF